MPRGVGCAPHRSCGLLTAAASSWAPLPRLFLPTETLQVPEVTPRSAHGQSPSRLPRQPQWSRATPQAPLSALLPASPCPFPSSAGELPALVPVSPRQLPILQELLSS